MNINRTALETNAGQVTDTRRWWRANKQSPILTMRGIGYQNIDLEEFDKAHPAPENPVPFGFSR